MLRFVPAVAGCVVLLHLSSVPAAAQEPERDDLRQGNPVWYTMSGIETCALFTGLVIAGAASLDDGTGGGGNDSQAGLAFASCLLLGIGTGYAAMANHWDPEPAFAIHGGIWNTLTLAMLGSLIDGANSEDPDDVFAFGPWSLVLGAAGAGLATLVGLTQFDTELEVALWYLAPLAGALVGLVTWLATDAWQEDGATDAEETRRAWTAALGGFGGTLLAAHGFAFAIRE